MNPETIMIDEQKYVRADCVKEKAEKMNGMEYVCIRSYDSGCHCGYLKYESEDSRKVILIKARRLWYWSGASSLSQLAMDGVKNPNDCKFPCEVDEITITKICEIIKMTDKAKKSIQGVSIWKS